MMMALLHRKIRKRDHLLRPIGAALAIAVAVSGVQAQNTQTPVESSIKSKEARELELDRVRINMEEAAQRQKALKEEIAAFDKDQAAVNRALIEAAKRSQELEATIDEAESRLAILSAEGNKLRQSLSKKRALMAEVLGALQRMGKKPPPALLIRPEDALASVRSAILLGAVLPEIRSETDILLGEMQALTENTRKIETEKTTLAEDLNALAEDETRLTLLIEEKKQLATRSRENLQSEQEKIEKLANEAVSLVDLINKLETQIESAAVAANAAKSADKKRRQEELKRLAKAEAALESGPDKNGSKEGVLGSKLGDTGRIEPAIAFRTAKGSLPLPVSGVQLYAFGSANKSASTVGSAAGSVNRNVAYATRPNARVRAPADGWVVYAGPFRSYGQLLILNAGEGYHIVLAGLSQVNVETGRFVLAGEPVGRMGTTRIAAVGLENLGSTRPVLYVEFRKDGKSIDPSPWWAQKRVSSNQKGPDNDS